MNNSIQQLLNQATTLLQKNVERPRLEAEILLSHILDVERTWLHIHFNDNVNPKNYFELITRRCQNEPLEYITGYVNFYSETFFAQEGVLIARPETELLIDHASTIIKNNSNIKTIAEIGMGSGIISIMLAKMFPDHKFIATDINTTAIELTKKNMALHQVEDRITLYHTSLLDNIDEPINMIVSNPPYIAADELLEAHVLKEPKEALFGGNIGDELLKKIIDLSFVRNIPSLICEMGYDQKASLEQYIKRYNKKATFYQDYSALDRGFWID
jgi:release factor glutamine methyltransferase